MADMRVRPGALCGTVEAPPSKSAAHRAFICAALSGGVCQVSPVSHSADMIATLGVLQGFGLRISQKAQTVFFEGCGTPADVPLLDCRESGSTLRFLLPVAAALGLHAKFTGAGRLPERPLEPLLTLMREHGTLFSADKIPFTIAGKLKSGVYPLPGDVSSQFVSGLLFALPLLDGDSEIVLTSPLQSAGYVDMTLDAIAKAGISIERTTNGFWIPGGQRYLCTDKVVEGDWSNAAFWLCAGAVGGAVTVCGLDMVSVQGDKAVVEILREFGAQVQIKEGCVTVQKAPLKGLRIDAAPIPDLVPVLAVTAAFADGETEFYNAGRLRIKESDRIATVAALLRALGGAVREYDDRLVICGGGLRGGIADGANDHRIVMSAAIAALGSTQAVQITGVQAVGKSYPDFFEVLRKLGGNCDVI